jgi:carbon starvation protein CstA
MSAPAPDVPTTLGVVILLQTVVTAFCLPPVTTTTVNTLLWITCRVALVAYWLPTVWILLRRRERLNRADIRFVTYGYPLILLTSLVATILLMVLHGYRF